MGMTDFLAQAKREREEAEDRFRLYRNGEVPGPGVPDQVRQLLRDAYEAGYKPWIDSRSKPSNPFFLQRCVRDQEGQKLYFINIEVWDIHQEFPQHRWGASFTPKVQFYLPGRQAVDVKLHAGEHTLATVEEFFQDFYVKMNCEPYGD